MAAGTEARTEAWAKTVAMAKAGGRGAEVGELMAMVGERRAEVVGWVAGAELRRGR